MLSEELNPIAKKYADVIESSLEHLVGNNITPDIIDGLVKIILQTECDFVGVAESADLAGVSRQRISQLFQKGKMPPTAGVIAAGRFWLKNDIEDFVTERQLRAEKYSGIPHHLRSTIQNTNKTKDD